MPMPEDKDGSKNPPPQAPGPEGIRKSGYETQGVDVTKSYEWPKPDQPTSPPAEPKKK